MHLLRLLPLLLLWLPALGAEFPPRPAGPIADLANLIDAPAEQKIGSVAQALWEQAGFGLVVATLPTLDGQVIEDYAPALYKNWGIGKKGVDEGVLILLSLDPKRARIEVGYGSEGYLNDARTGRLLDEYGVPYFRRGDYSNGLVNLSAAIAGEVGKEKNITLALPAAGGPVRGRGAQPTLPPWMLIPLALIFIALISTPFGRGFLLAMILSNLGGGRGGGGFGGGFGGGGFGGGFGGGMSGGGGSSRGF